MKVALTIWENRISPVFDSATRILIAEIENAEVTTRHIESFDPERPSHLAMSLNIRDVETLICGAISELPAGMIEAEGIELIPFITGDVVEVLGSYAKGIPIIPEFLMPGCVKKKYRKCKNRNNSIPGKKEVDTMTRGTGTGSQGQSRRRGQVMRRCNKGKGYKETGNYRSNDPNSKYGTGRGKGNPDREKR